MQLHWLEARFVRRLNALETHHSDFLARAQTPPSKGVELYELEGWVSDWWQVWCRFCRRIVIESSLGCIGAGGAVFPSVHASEPHVSHIAWKQKAGIAPTMPGTNSILRKEPTWGDVDKLLEIIGAVNPANAPSLLAAFGTVPNIDHLRLIRNAAAHMNAQTLGEVIALQPLYRSTPIQHPLHALMWIEPTSGKTLAQALIQDMRIAARNACS
ncbi:hypothetical protein [Janthinobacterium sp. UMAB-56]|uniref:hypothetical protein n=1 Tax=Janthinobacterium sp. UMAB-56 TaxID=1365361 RepID=UPI001C59D5B2|nr:hypothetical protein [Janthinobacterium sp. UMAB-56]